jgi:aryl-alcohol dehydrogenase-like predicted oxidoreductase
VPTPSAGRGANGLFRKRYDLDDAANAGKLDAADALASLAEENGLTLVELAIAFVVNHPAVTAAIIGPRTMEQLTTQLPAADLTLPPAVLDRIDQIVTPGTTPNPFDSAYVNPALTTEALRRRA